MKDPKGSGLAERLASAAAARAAVMAKFRPKAGVAAPPGESRAELRDAELVAVRQGRTAAKAATRLASEEKAAAQQAAALVVEEAALAAKRGARKERKQLTKTEAQAKRDARYAARKAR
jgi:hypothetical protein